MSVNVEELKSKLAKYIIAADKPEHSHIPKSLVGEVLLEEVKSEDGRILGWITITPENLATAVDKIKKKEAAEEALGLKKYFDKWRSEGVTI
ncbi:MAG: hypothetical protein QXE51_03315 [Nitrososphaeria archaeon]